MQERKHVIMRRRQQQQKASIALSITGPVSRVVTATVERLRNKYGMSFFLLQRRESGGVRCMPLLEAFQARDMDTVVKRDDVGGPRTTASLPLLGEHWSRSWTQPPGEQQTQCHIAPHLPDALLQLLVDMGVVDASQDFSLIGGLTPAAGQWEMYHPSSSHAASSTPPMQPITSLYINAVDSVVEVTHQLSPHTRAACVLRHQRKQSAWGAVENDLEGDGSLSKPLSPRFFLLSPYAPYDALHKVVNGGNVAAAATAFCGGDACEVLLVYMCSTPSTSALGLRAADRRPEVWGRPPHHPVRDIRCSAAPLHADDSDELFFIAACVEDYIRLGTAFSWVYGWQLCYASRGPPPRSLPWMKLLSPSALSAAICNSV